MTKIINETNKTQYGGVLSNLEEGEEALLVYFRDSQNWFLLTNTRIIFSNGGSMYSINNSEISNVQPALTEEINDKVMVKENFTRLKVKTKRGESIVCNLESGASYQGIYQVLHFIASNNGK